MYRDKTEIPMGKYQIDEKTGDYPGILPRKSDQAYTIILQVSPHHSKNVQL